MGILSELTALLAEILPVETGVFSGVAPDCYAVVTPLADDFELYGDNAPQFESQEARISLYCKGNYLSAKRQVEKALLAQDFTITLRQYIGREDDTSYFHWACDCAKIFVWEG